MVAYTALWKVNIPSKIKYFIWLCLKHKILTWDSLQRCGFIEPGRCVICHNALETAEHIFGDCLFFQQNGQSFCNSLNCQWQWVNTCIADNLMNWSLKLQLPLEVPLILIWEVWCAKNDYIFQKLPMSHTRILIKACSYSMFLDAFVKKVVSRNFCYPLVINVNDALVGFFDGAENDGLCGAGMVIRMDLNHSFWLCMDVG